MLFTILLCCCNLYCIVVDSVVICYANFFNTVIEATAVDDAGGDFVSPAALVRLHSDGKSAEICLCSLDTMYSYFITRKQQ